MTRSSSATPSQPSSVQANAPVSTTADGPRTPYGCAREHGSGYVSPPSTTSLYSSPAPAATRHSQTPPPTESSATRPRATSTASARTLGAHTRNSTLRSSTGTAPNARLNGRSPPPDTRVTYPRPGGSILSVRPRSPACRADLRPP